ncbi:hypothetical protein Tco_0888713 [Tanacetum coccineum]
MENRHDLRFTALAFFLSAGSVPSMRYLRMGISPSPISFLSLFQSLQLHYGLFLCFSTSTCLLKCAKLIDAILLNASAFLFSFLGTCFIENALKLLSIGDIHPSGLVSISPAPDTIVRGSFVNKMSMSMGVLKRHPRGIYVFAHLRKFHYKVR